MYQKGIKTTILDFVFFFNLGIYFLTLTRQRCFSKIDEMSDFINYTNLVHFDSLVAIVCYIFLQDVTRVVMA